MGEKPSIAAQVAIVASVLVASILALVLAGPVGEELDEILPPDTAESVVDFVRLGTTQWMLGHIVINWVVAVAAAMATGTFELKRLSEFLWRKILPLMGVYFAGVSLGGAISAGAVTDAVFIVLEARLLADLVENLGKLGVTLPDALKSLFPA